MKNRSIVFNRTNRGSLQDNLQALSQPTTSSPSFTMNPTSPLVIDPANLCSVALCLALLASMLRYYIGAVQSDTKYRPRPVHEVFNQEDQTRLSLWNGLTSGCLDCLAVLFMYQGLKSLSPISMFWSTLFGATLIVYHVVILYFIGPSSADDCFRDKRTDIEWRYPARWVLVSLVPLVYLAGAWIMRTPVGPKWPYFAGFTLSLIDWIFIHPWTQGIWERKGVNITGQDDDETLVDAEAC